MSTWVIASNPATYNAEASLDTNGQMDWVTNNKFELGIIVTGKQIGRAHV